MSNARLTREEQIKLNLSEKLILYYRKNPVEAAHDLLGVRLTWFQRITLRGLWFKKWNLLLMSRGIGKTWLLALFAVLYAMLYCKVKIGVITPSFKQTEFLYDKIGDFYEDSAYLRAATAKFSRTTYRAWMLFHNRSFIEGLPLGTGQKIRGRRYNVLLIDEYAQVDEDIIKLVVRPMMNVKQAGVDNKMIISSTAYYTWNHFYMQYLLYNVLQAKNPKTHGLYEYTFEDLKMVKDAPYELDEDVYEMMRMDTTKELYEMENLCRFPVENVGFFSARLLDSCTPVPTRDDQDPFDLCPIELTGDGSSFYTMGIDAARVQGGDNFAISIMKIQNGIKKLSQMFTLNGAPYQEMIYHIRRLLEVFNVVQINMDAGGGGTTIKDLLAQTYKMIDGRQMPAVLDMDDKETEMKEGLRILRMVNFTRPVVNDLYMRLKADMQHKTLNMPIEIRRHSDKEIQRAGIEILETKRELLVLQAEGRGNYYTFEVPTQFKKDRATALALSNQAANDFLADFEEVAEMELAEGFWVNSSY